MIYAWLDAPRAARSEHMLVEFFSQEWEKLGDTTSLNSFIHKITGNACITLIGPSITQRSRGVDGAGVRQDI